MKTPGDFKKEIESRLKQYLSRDKTGIRHELVKLFLKTRSLTVAEIYERLRKRFSITYHSVASMVGIIASRIGILHVKRNTDNSIANYELKEQYSDIVMRLVGPV
jgi:(p)ppGpp synthase/HD superfamily hydrolase